MSNDIKLSDATEAIKAGKQAERALADALQCAGVEAQSDQDTTVEWPQRVGNVVLIATVTRYYTGRIVAITDRSLLLVDAAWIGHTGHLSEALVSGVSALQEIEPFARPVQVERATIVDTTDWRHPLPKEQKK